MVISYMQLREYKQALGYCRQAVQLKPDNINFKKDLANVERIVRLQEQAEEATLDIRKKLGEKPGKKPATDIAATDIPEA